jgi:hypothetical protein
MSCGSGRCVVTESVYGEASGSFGTDSYNATLFIVDRRRHAPYLSDAGISQRERGMLE